MDITLRQSIERFTADPAAGQNRTAKCHFTG
jgi:hypothetical protein